MQRGLYVVSEEAGESIPLRNNHRAFKLEEPSPEKPNEDPDAPGPRHLCLPDVKFRTLYGRERLTGAFCSASGAAGPQPRPGVPASAAFSPTFPGARPSEDGGFGFELLLSSPG